MCTPGIEDVGERDGGNGMEGGSETVVLYCCACVLPTSSSCIETWVLQLSGESHGDPK